MRRMSALPLLAATLALTACPLPDAPSTSLWKDLGQMATSDGAAATWGDEALVLKLETVAAVKDGPTAKTVFTLDTTTRVTKVFTYHHHGGAGSPPGTIAFKEAATGQVFGPWKAVGMKSLPDLKPGAAWPSTSNGTPPLYWIVQPDVTLPAGRYEVVDSDPATWSTNDELKGMGCAWVYGRPSVRAAAPPPTASARPGSSSKPGASARPAGIVPPALTVPSAAPVKDAADAVAAIVALADAEAAAYAELLDLHSAGGTRPLFAPDVTFGDDALARLVRAQQAVLTAGVRFEAALAHLDRAASKPATRRVLGTPGDRHLTGLGQKLRNFFGLPAGSGPRLRDGMSKVMNRLDSAGREETFEVARGVLGPEAGENPTAFIGRLDTGKLDARLAELHQGLCLDAPAYNDAAARERLAPADVVAKEGGLGLSTGVDVMVESTNVELPGINKAKKLADALEAPVATNIREWVKTRVHGVDADATSTRIGQEAAEFLGGMKSKVKGPTRGKLVVTVGETPPGELPADVSSVIVTNRDTGRLHVATGGGVFVLPPGTYDVYVVGKGGKVAVDQGEVVTADAETVVASALVPPPITGSVTTGFLDGWALMPVTIHGAKLTRDAWREGWRNNGQSWAATANAGVTRIEADIICKGPAWSYEDYRYSIEITAAGSEKRTLATEQGTLPKDGGTKHVEVTFDPRQEVAWFGKSGTVNVALSLTGGNPESSTRYSRGEISFIWP